MPCNQTKLNKICHYGHLDGLYDFKLGPLNDPLEEKKKAYVEVPSELWGISSIAMHFSVRNCRVSRVLRVSAFLGEAARTLVFSPALSEVYYVGYYWRFSAWSSGPVAGTCTGRCPSHRRTWPNMALTFDFDCLAFFGLSDVRDFHWELCRLTFWSYSKIRVTLSTNTLRTKAGWIWRRSMMSWHSCMWNSFSHHSTIPAPILLKP